MRFNSITTIWATHSFISIHNLSQFILPTVAGLMSDAEETKDELDTLTGSQKTSANGTNKQGSAKVSLTHNQ